MNYTNKRFWEVVQKSEKIAENWLHVHTNYKNKRF